MITEETARFMESTAREYREIQAEMKALEEQADALKQEMIRIMDEQQADVMAAGAFKVRYTLVETSRLDTARLKAEQADIYAAYTKHATSTRFQVA